MKNVDNEPENNEQQRVPKELQPYAWQPGQSGNPAGRPSKVKSLTGILESKVNRERIAKKLIRIANDDKTPALQLEAIKYIYARIEGNPIQAMRHQIEGAVGPLIFLHPGRDDNLQLPSGEPPPPADTTDSNE